MAEIDYQMALLLQHRFEQEYKTKQNSEKTDQEIARELQQQFELEEATEKPSNGLVYKETNNAQNSSRSLVDPSWELVDPTPDIHNLFMVFNDRYFWNKLLAVCVSWSKRMTSCAGICSYNGRGGLCSITLSEPLLKLRPRKDLVETLLHEMIHAYLFVTHNNKDRDGHGPEFHKHMYRINKESGTNITVYHDFHDEVRLYKQHWWRCNGPCQQRKPFFGMVRRATNRAPGPNDFWWAEHSRTCNGTFIKVKEPEKKKVEKKVEEKSVTKNKDIRDFITGANSSNIKGFKDLTNIDKGKSNPSSTSSKNAKGVKGKSNSTSTSSTTKSSGSSNVKGFKDLTNGSVRGKSNSSSTIIVTKNSKTNTESSFTPTIFNAGTTGIITKTDASTIPDVDKTDYTNDFLSVRNHWANKFSTTNKRPAIEPSATTSKVSRISTSAPSECPENFCNCPVCNERVPMKDLNSHLDICLDESKPPVSSKEEKLECPVCSTMLPCSIYEVHVEECWTKATNETEEKPKEESVETVSCLACGKTILRIDLNSHLDDCMIDIFDGDSGSNQGMINNTAGPSDSEFNCPFCMKLVKESEMKEHLDACLQGEGGDVVESLMEEF